MFLKQDHFILKEMHGLTIPFFFQFVKYCEQAVCTLLNLGVFLLVYRCIYDVGREVSDGVVIIFLIQ